MHDSGIRVIFADRDGTINLDIGYVSRVEDWKFLPGAIESLRSLHEYGFKIAIVSNQAGVADGRYTEENIRTLHNHMCRALEEAKVPIAAIAYCPHDRTCEICRKPATGMAREIERQLGTINYAESWVVGDKTTDVEFGRNINARTALIRSRYWDFGSLQIQPDLIVESLLEFATIVTRPDSTYDRTNWRTHKILAPSAARTLANTLRSAGKSLVTTNGSFDLLHAGHLDQLEEAKRQGDILFVGINTDEAIREAKGPNRPVVPLDARAAVLAALACVDYVVLMSGSYKEEPMKSILKVIRPHIHVNGPDYGSPNTWVEWPTMQEEHIAGYTIPKRNNISTTMLLQRLRRET